MKSKIQFPLFSTLMMIYLLLLIFSCKKDNEMVIEEDINKVPDFYVEGAMFNCPSEVVDLSEISFQINQAYKYEDLVFAGGFDKLGVFNPATGELNEIDDIGVNHFLEYNGKLMICAEEGLFSIDADQNIVHEAMERCFSALVSADGTFLMTGNNPKILSWNDTEGLFPYTDAQRSSHISLDNLMEISNGELWTRVGNGKIARFKDQLFLDFFESDNFPINEFLLEPHTFMTPYEDGAILVAKNGPTYQIFKYTNNQEWVVLFDSQLAEKTDKYYAITQPSITDILIREDKLYVATTIAGCKGFQVFDITKNELLSPEDYYPQFDSNFESHCIHGMDYDSNGDILTISSNQVLIYDCN